MVVSSAKLLGHFQRFVISSQKCGVASCFVDSHRQLTMSSRYSLPPDDKILATSQASWELKKKSRQNRDALFSSHKTYMHLMSSSSRSFPSSWRRTLLGFGLNCANSISCQPVTVLLYRSLNVKRSQKVNTLEEDEQQHDQTDPIKEHNAWLLRMSNENNYLSWCRNIYIATLVAYTTSILAPGHSAAEGAFIVIAFSNLFFGTTSFIYNTLRLRHKMRMSFLSVAYNLFLAVLHLLLYIICVSLYNPLVGDFLNEDDNDE